MDVAELIAISAQAATDPTWVGSDRHLSLLTRFVKSDVPGASVRWGSPEEKSFSQGSVISIERPVDGADPDLLMRTALVVLHETLHLKHSDALTAAPYRRHLATWRQTGKVALADYAHDLFQALEDARIGVREEATSSENAVYLSELNRQTIVQHERDYLTRTGEPLWSLRPRSSLAQSKLALLSRIYAPSQPRVVHPTVGQIVAEAGPVVDRAVKAPSTDEPRSASFEIVNIVRSHAHDLS